MDSVHVDVSIAVAERGGGRLQQVEHEDAWYVVVLGISLLHLCLMILSFPCVDIDGSQGDFISSFTNIILHVAKAESYLLCLFFINYLY